MPTHQHKKHGLRRIVCAALRYDPREVPLITYATICGGTVFYECHLSCYTPQARARVTPKCRLRLLCIILYDHFECIRSTGS